MAEKIQQYTREYKNAVNDIMKDGVRLKNPYERVRICLWIERLNMLRDDDLEQVRMKNEYAQYMRICLKDNVGVLPAPFSAPPPSTELVSLAEYLANLTAEKYPNIPRTGRLQPIICHKSDDDRAFMTVKRCPDGGIFCYMCVAPDALGIRPSEKI